MLIKFSRGFADLCNNPICLPPQEGLCKQKSPCYTIPRSVNSGCSKKEANFTDSDISLSPQGKWSILFIIPECINIGPTPSHNVDKCIPQDSPQDSHFPQQLQHKLTAPIVYCRVNSICQLKSLIWSSLN